MKCSCSIYSPFLFRQHVRPSLFAADPAFAKGSKSGKTMGAIQTAAVERVTVLTGRNPGSLFGISAHADRLTEQGIHERQKKARAAGQRRSAR